MNRPKILIFGYGNRSRGDDALGPLLVQRLSHLKHRHCWQHIELLEDYQLQVEHALDLPNHAAVVFVDASIACQAPFNFEPINAEQDLSYSSHRMNPKALLFVCSQVLQQPPPPAFLLGIRGVSFELGSPLSDEAENHLGSALSFITDWCQHHNPHARHQTIALK